MVESPHILLKHISSQAFWAYGSVPHQWSPNPGSPQQNQMSPYVYQHSGPALKNQPCVFWKQHQGEPPELSAQQVFHQRIDGSSCKHSWFLRALLAASLGSTALPENREKCSKNTALTIRPATWWFQSLLEFPSHLNSRGCWGKAVKEEPCLPTLKNLQGDPVIGYSLWPPLEAGTWRLLFSAFALVQFWYNSKNKIK